MKLHTSNVFQCGCGSKSCSYCGGEDPTSSAAFSRDDPSTSYTTIPIHHRHYSSSSNTSSTTQQQSTSRLPNYHHQYSSSSGRSLQPHHNIDMTRLDSCSSDQGVHSGGESVSEDANAAGPSNSERCTHNNIEFSFDKSSCNCNSSYCNFITSRPGCKGRGNESFKQTLRSNSNSSCISATGAEGGDNISSTSSNSDSRLNINGTGLRECLLCLQDVPRDQFPKLCTCSHSACLTCLKQYLAMEISESRINITCPKCTELMHPTGQ